MKLRFQKTFLFIILLLLFALFLPAGAVSASAEGSSAQNAVTIDTNWWFESISVEMDVRRDKTVAVTEKLQVGYINGGKTSYIIRDIQRISRTTRIVNGKQKVGTQYFAKLSDVSVTINGEPAFVTQSLYDDGQFFAVKMQKQDLSYFSATDQKNHTGYHFFELSYVYDMSDDKAKGYDDFTFDVLGYAMDYTKRFSATVTFPTAINEADVSYRTNKLAAWNPSEENGEYVRVEGNTVTISASPMSKHKGYTLQVLFEDGYFETGRTFFWHFVLFAVLAVLAIAAGIAVFWKYGPRKPVEQVEFYPPEGMRAMRYSAIWHSAARKKDVAAVITQWAAEGYVRLEQDVAHKKELIVYKLKDIEGSGASKEERDYFNAMFPLMNGQQIDVFSTYLMQKSGATARRRALATKADALVKKANEPSPLKAHNKEAYVILTVCTLFPILMTLIYFCILCSTALPIFFFIFMTAGTGLGAMQARQRISWNIYIFPVFYMAFTLVAFLSLFYVPLYDYCGLLWISLAWWVASFVLMHLMKGRSPEAQAQLGKMYGFKRFLLTAELDRIERLFDENPDYYSQIIPFCLIMGISDKVAQRFETLHVAAPEWARGISMRSLHSFSHSLSHSSGGGSGSHGGGGGRGGSHGGGGGGGGSRGG